MAHNNVDKSPVLVSAIMLVRHGDSLIVRAEVRDEWVTVITECAEGPCSHIVESSGIRTAAKKIGLEI